MRIFSFSPFGYEGSLVNVEVDLRRGIPAVDIVGLADGAVKESRERMRAAIHNSGLDFPPERVLINLSPADLKKEGAGFDLPVALSVLYAQEAGKNDSAKFIGDVLVIGELELNGNIRPVRGIYAAVSTAKAGGIGLCIVPSQNSAEAKEIPGMKVFGASTLLQAFSALKDESLFCPSYTEENEERINKVNILGVDFPKEDSTVSLSDIKGQDFLLRGMQIAAAGGHNLLAFGPPGCGKTLSLQRFPLLLPLLTQEEARAVTRIYSIAGLLSPGSSILRNAPFRMPHQTASIEGICGGGIHCTPGEISLAHRGTLFLDEGAEFKTSVLQMLRVPLENGSITLSRAGRSTTYPADFQLLIATNPCPCGFYGSKEKICLCSGRAVEQYWKKFSGPLLDRMDIRIKVEENINEISNSPKTTESLRTPIAKAVYVQRERQGKKNASLNPQEILTFCTCTTEARDSLLKAEKLYDFSPRASAACLKLARTIADMSGEETISENCMNEAILYRKTACGIGEVLR